MSKKIEELEAELKARNDEIFKSPESYMRWLISPEARLYSILKKDGKAIDIQKELGL